MSTQNMQRDVYSRFICNCQNLEATQISLVSEQINELWYIQTMKYYSMLKIGAIKPQKKHGVN